MTITTTNTNNTKQQILPFQKPIFERLSAVARACLYVDRRQFTAIKLRACFWLIGPTGTGKTFLARALAREMGVPFLTVSVSDWIILGGSNKGSGTTWPNILKFLNKNKQGQGAIIFIDELDKCRDDSNWNTYLRSEIFSLCDARIPLGIKDEDGCDYSESILEEAHDYLQNRVMILGGAAFQELWENESQGNSIGFNPEPQAIISQPELPHLAKILPRELINRFSSEMFILPELKEDDYFDMLESMAEYVQETWRSRFVDIGLSRLKQAARHQKGVRFMEEVLLAAVVEERSALVNWVPESVIEVESVESDKTDDGKIMGIF